MPRIYDNIEQRFLDALKDTLRVSHRADFCVGYFNLRGWRQIEDLMQLWQGGEAGCCRLMIGMQDKPQDELRQVFRFTSEDNDGLDMDQQTALRLKRRVAQDFRDQLIVGAPTNYDQQGLQRLSEQLKRGRVVVKLYLRHKLHAKLYLLHRHDKQVPIVGYTGSSNLTFAGLSHQGELNVDVVEDDACKKLARWFDERWADRWCLDISQELAAIIDESWARAEQLPPYLIYLKMAYHLSQEARTGLLEFNIPKDMRNVLFDYQAAAVKIAAHHLNKRGGVLIGDVVGLGKTLMATALARVMQEDYSFSTLIICPKNLVKMWEEYVQDYALTAMVLSSSMVIKELPGMRRYRVVIVDESHNLRNSESKRFKVIKDYIERNESKCILLTATPYNKNYRDISAQLRLFLTDDKAKDLGIRPEKLLSEKGEDAFMREHQHPVRSLAAFEQSNYPDDWRDLMRLYMVRRTRSFIQEYYAMLDKETGRRYLTFRDGTRSYFPTRQPRTIKFALDEERRDDQYARLYSEQVLTTINRLNLPRYGLANYLVSDTKQKGLAPTASERQSIKNLSRGGKRLMGFCRTGLFKRLESGGPAFIQSLERHTLRNFIVLYALEAGLEVPIGAQNAELLDATTDEDENVAEQSAMDDEETTGAVPIEALPLSGVDEYRRKAAEVYQDYATRYRSRFKWIRPIFFNGNLAKALLADCQGLLDVLVYCGTWNADNDAKLGALADLLTHKHPAEKVLVFTQFADTVYYLTEQLKARGIAALAGVTGDSANPTELAWRFSPTSNGKRKSREAEQELRVLIATDVLSEGQNLQDAAIVVNYDLPWAIIRLIQRAGRVDRIGQRSDIIHCYSFLPADGVEQLIRLRERVRQRLRENAEVVGTDEAFFEDDGDNTPLLDLYNEKAGILDGDGDTEVDLTSHAYQIWKSAIDARPELKAKVEKLPNVVFSTRAHQHRPTSPQGVLVYMRTGDGNDSLAWINRKGESVTQSQLAILTAAACTYDTLPIDLPGEQHELVRQGVEQLVTEDRSTSGQLGRPSSARYRAYERMKRYVTDQKKQLIKDFEAVEELDRAVDRIYNFPLIRSAADAINRQIKSGADDKNLAELVLTLYKDERLCLVHEEDEAQYEAQILCSLGLF
ncbi:MAG: helicase-related protein [Ktedonobacteraceae bacterium]